MGMGFLKQIHNFILKNDSCMAHWKRRYVMEVKDNEVDFGEWASRNANPN